MKFIENEIVGKWGWFIKQYAIFGSKDTKNKEYSIRWEAWWFHHQNHTIVIYF